MRQFRHLQGSTVKSQGMSGEIALAGLVALAGLARLYQPTPGSGRIGAHNTAGYTT